MATAAALEKDKKDLPAVVGSAASLIQVIQAAAANPAADIEKMERLFAMHQKMVAREAETSFNDAMSRVQAKVLPVATNAENTHTHSRYAKLAAISRAIAPIYTLEGFSISFDTEKADRDGWQKIVAIVSHAAGHSRKHALELPMDDSGAQGTKNKTGVQAAGSTNSYGRRYLTCMIFNVSTEDDNDGNRDEGGEGLAEKVVADHLAAIDAASDELSLRKAFGAAYTAAEKAKDKPNQRAFMAAKDKRKAALVKK